jgi:hypothetical protein
MTDDDWLANEKLEEKIHTMRELFEDSPAINLYDWLLEAHPEVFKQWQSIYDIEREN